MQPLGLSIGGGGETLHQDDTTLRVSKLKFQPVSVFTDDSRMTRHLGTLGRNAGGQIQAFVQMVSLVKEQDLDLDGETDRQS